MCYIPVNAIPIGAILAEPVVANGEDLFPKGTKVNLNVKEALVKFGIKDVRVQTYLNVLCSEDSVDLENISEDYLEKLRKVNTEDVRAFAAMLVNYELQKPIKSPMKLLKKYDLDTYQHSINVATLACVLGIYYKLPYDKLRELVVAGLLHDIGKTVIPIEVLHKPGRLDLFEFSVMKAHTLEGFLLLNKDEDISNNVLFAILDHHENHNGTGYPRGLSGNTITLYAQFIHLCDVYDALCSPRPYKEAYTHQEALKFIQNMSGTMFNPDLVKVFSKCIPLYQIGEVLNLYGHVGIVVTREGDNYVLVRCDNELFTLSEFYTLQKVGN